MTKRFIINEKLNLKMQNFASIPNRGIEALEGTLNYKDK